MVLEPEPNHRGIRSQPPPKQTVKNIEEKEYGGNIMASLMEQVSCLTWKLERKISTGIRGGKLEPQCIRNQIAVGATTILLLGTML